MGDLENQIINDYTKNKYSIYKLCDKYHLGKIKIKQILNNNNVKINQKGGQVKYHDKKEIKVDTQNKVLICKKCGKTFNDVYNNNGSIISHIKKCQPNINIPSKFKRKKYEENNGIFWYLQYFDLINKKKVNTLKCPICDWITKDVNNKTGAFTKHINKKHNNVKSFLENNSEYKHLFNIKIDENDFVTCKLCEQKMSTINNIHLKYKHGITVKQYKKKFPNEKLTSKAFSEKLRKNRIIANINSKPTWTSKGEKEIGDFIKTLGVHITKSKNRKLLNGKEIDILIPKYKIGIEYDGLYYHTEKMGKTSTYHLDKTLECKKQGYDLIHIFEDEWITKPNIIKSKIKHILKLNDNTHIGARQTKIKTITTDEKSEFLKLNHIQGNDKAKIKYGAFHNNKLVGVMTFNDKRNMTKNNINEYELSRFAINIDYTVNGLASKFLKHFIKEYDPNSIISFADRRWTPDAENNMYIKLGFEIDNILKPNYFYYNTKINRYKRFHKFGFGKKMIKKKYPDVDMNKSEKILMEELGYSRIWDCGLIKFKKTIKKGD